MENQDSTKKERKEGGREGGRGEVGRKEGRKEGKEREGEGKLGAVVADLGNSSVKSTQLPGYIDILHELSSPWSLFLAVCAFICTISHFLFSGHHSGF